MFKLIGIAVVIGVLFVGYDALQKWYVGDATPGETVTEVRKKVGEKILGQEDNQSSTSTPPPNQTSAAVSPSGGKPLDTDEMLRKMMEKK